MSVALNQAQTNSTMDTCNTHGLSGDSPKRRKKQKASDEALLDARHINALIQESLNSFAAENKSRMYKEECAHAVATVLSEFLQNYILIGYDFNGTPIKIVNANSGLGADALHTFLQKFMMNLYSSDARGKNA